MENLVGKLNLTTYKTQTNKKVVKAPLYKVSPSQKFNSYHRIVLSFIHQGPI